MPAWRELSCWPHQVGRRMVCKGRDVVIPMGTEFYVEVMRDARVSGLSLIPGV